MPTPLFLLPFLALGGWSVFAAIMRVLASLGIGFAVYVGLDTLYDSLVSDITTNLNSAHYVILQMLSLAGFIDAIGIILGAISARIALIPLRRILFGPRTTQGWM